MTTFSRAYPTANPKAQSQGLVSWAYEPEIAAVALAPTSQTIYLESLWLPAGVPINYLWFFVSVAASGSVPTSIIAGLENGATLVAQSAELKSDAGWTSVGIRRFALSATFTPPAAGFYRIGFWQNGAWGTTQLQLGNRTVAATGKGDLAFIPWGTGGVAAGSFPANGAAFSSVVIASNAIWCGASS